MTTAQLLQYLQDYLHTSDGKTIGYLPSFLAIAANRVRSRCSGVIIESMASFTPQASATLPAGFIAFAQISVSGIPLAWTPPDQFAAVQLDNPPPDITAPRYYTIQADTLLIWPTPSGSDTGTYDYYALDGNNLGSNNAVAELLPSLLLRGAASEAYRYEGDNESAAAEELGFAAEVDALNESRFIAHGPLSMAGI